MPKDIVEYIVKAMVDRPELVSVNVKKDGQKVLLEVKVDEGDLGKVIGKGGATIKSIMAVVGIITKDRNLFVDIAK